MHARAGQHSSAGGRRGRKKRLFDDWILNTRQIARIEFLLFASNTSQTGTSEKYHREPTLG